MYEIDRKEMRGSNLVDFVYLKRLEEDSITFLKEGARTYYILIENRYEDRIELYVVDVGELYRSRELTIDDIEYMVNEHGFDWDLMSRTDIAVLIDRLDIGKTAYY